MLRLCFLLCFRLNVKYYTEISLRNTIFDMYMAKIASSAGNSWSAPGISPLSSAISNNS